MQETNRYPDRCVVCAGHVKAGKGVRQGPPWRTYCPGCVPAAVVATHQAAKIVLRREGEGVVRVDILGRLNGQFDAYRSACTQAGARSTKEEDGWVTRVKTPTAPKLVFLLKEAGLVVEVEASLRVELEDAVVTAHEAVKLGEERLAAADAALAETGRSLRAYQREGVRWLCSRGVQGALLADDMGLGKTAQALIALPPRAGVVVVCPAVAKGVWRREIKKWRSELRPTVLEGRGCFTRWPAPGEVLIVNYDVLSGPPDNCPAGVVLIADEAHALKNGKAARTKHFREISRAVRDAGGRTWLVTATPLTNRPGELWSVLSAAGLEKEAFGSWNNFKDLFGAVETRFGIEWGYPCSEVPGLLRRVMLRRDKKDVAKDLPAKSRHIQEVTLTKEGLRGIADVIRGALKEGTDLDEVLHQIEQGVADFEVMAKLRAALAAAKLPAVLEIVEAYEEQEEPLVVFSAHRYVVDELAKRDGWGRITGDETAEQKSEVEEAFQAGKLKGIAATIKAGGVAITLTRACNVVFVDQAWTPADNAQAEDRVYRLGQTRPVQVTILQSDHAIDERVIQLLMHKLALYEGSVGAARLQEGEVDASVRAESAPTETTRTVPMLAVATPTPKRPKRRLYWRGETTPEPDMGTPRLAQTPQEEWVVAGFETLADHDEDNARQRNNVGFNQADSFYGHAMAATLRYEGLTDRGWAAAIKLLKKYHRQIGKCPE